MVGRLARGDVPRALVESRPSRFSSGSVKERQAGPMTRPRHSGSPPPPLRGAGGVAGAAWIAILGAVGCGAGDDTVSTPPAAVVTKDAGPAVDATTGTDSGTGASDATTAEGGDAAV